MKAIIYDKKSATSRLTYREVQKPEPKENELLVEVHAASINAADYRMLQMGFPPKKKIFGADVAGIVVAAGKDATPFKVGDQVVGDLSNFGFGGFAEYVAAPARAFVPKPAALSFEDAAALPLAAVTALQAVRNKGMVKQGDQVLIIGCSGGVGFYALQLAKHFGATVTGVCSARNEAQARALGADSVIDYGKTDLSQLSSRYDLVLAINGDYALSLCKRLLKPQGRYVMVGGSLRQIFKALLLGWAMSLGSKKMSSLSAKSNSEDLRFILKLAQEGKLRPVLDRSVGLADTPEAFQYIREGHAKGKVVVRVKG